MDEAPVLSIGVELDFNGLPFQYIPDAEQRDIKSTFFFTMFATRRLLQACRITLFSRDNCGLCTQAKSVLSDVWDKRPFAYKEVNLALPESNSWRELYDFDIPVVRNSIDVALT